MKTIHKFLIAFSLTIVACVYAFNAKAQQTVKLLPVLPDIWVSYDTTLVIPTMLLNLSTNPVVFGYDGDGYIVKTNSSYRIEDLQEFIIRDKITGAYLGGRGKSYFDLNSNSRAWYPYGNCAPYYVRYIPSTILSLYPNLDTCELAYVPNLDTFPNDYVYINGGGGDRYNCSDSNAVYIGGLEERFITVDLVLNPPPSTGLASDTFSFDLYIGTGYQVFSGSAMPPLPNCYDLHVGVMPSIPTNATISGNTLNWESDACHDWVDKYLGWKQGNRIDWVPYWSGAVYGQTYTDPYSHTEQEIADYLSYYYAFRTNGRNKARIGYTIRGINSYSDFSLRGQATDFIIKPAD